MPEWNEAHDDVDMGDTDAQSESRQVLDAFTEAADAIVRAAQKFKRVTGEEGETFVPGLDDTSPVYKMPLAAYCLSMAHRLWHETQQLTMHRKHCELRDRLRARQPQPPLQPALPFGFSGALGGPLCPLPAEEFVTLMVGMTANLTSAQRQELIAQLQAQNDAENVLDDDDAAERPEPPEPPG